MYQELRAYSPMLDCDVVRLSMCDDQAGEFFMTVPDTGGKAFRAAKELALDAIAEAISLGLPPGEVRILNEVR